METYTMITSSGKNFDPFNPDPNDICIEDIGYGLSRACRFAGQLKPDKEFYSVAQHSVLATKWAIAEESNAINRHDFQQILLHDAAEAYIGDLVSPIKQEFLDYRLMEQQLLEIILTKFTNRNGWKGLIKKYDKWMFHLELTFLMPPHEKFPHLSETNYLPPTIPLYPLLAVQELWYPETAYNQFMELWKELNDG